MKIIWFCIPAHGHTNPTLGLVRRLVQAGHTIYFEEPDFKAGALKISESFKNSGGIDEAVAFIESIGK